MPAQPDRNITLTVATSTTASDKFGTGQGKQGSFQVPATGFTGTIVTVKVSNDGSTWVNCPVEGNETAAITVAAGGAYAFPTKAFCFRYIQLVTTSAQLTDQAFPVFMRD